MSDDASQADPIGQIADEFLAEFRLGRRPDVEEYAARYPECAEEIREILPALALMEKVKSFDEPDEEFPAPVDPEMTGREFGDYRITSRVVAEFSGHTHGVASVAWNHDGTQIASAAWDGTARIRDWPARREVVSFNGHPRHCFAVAWNPAGNGLVTVGDDHLIKFWDTQHAQTVLDIVATDDFRVDSFAFSPNGEAICSCSARGELVLWDAASGRRIHQLRDRQGKSSTVRFHPYGTLLASFTKNKGIQFYDVSTGELVTTIELPDSVLRYLDWSPDGAYIAAADSRGPIYVWDVATGEIVKTLGDDRQTVRCIRFRPDGRAMAVANSRGKVQIWDRQSETVQILSAEPPVAVRDLDWSSDGKRLAAAGDDHIVRVWHVDRGEVELSLRGHNEIVRAVQFGPSEQRILSADARGTLILWDAQTGEETLQLHERVGQLSTVCWSNDGYRIAAGSDGHILIWDATRGFNAERERNEAPR